MSKTLKRTEYIKFIETHILRPYQNKLTDKKEPFTYSKEAYNRLPEILYKCPDWRELVINRLAKIYDSVDFDFFPTDNTAIAILHYLNMQGVHINYD